MTDTVAHPLKLFNSLTRRMEEFDPVHAGEARVYTCGPTVYNYQHIGNMRAYIFADLLGRTLSWKGYKLTHIINITDVGHLTSDADAGDDKMEKAAAQSGKSAWNIAKYYTDAYWQDIERLNIRQPAKWAIATDHVEEMIAFAKSIADKHCYELDSGLYFDVSTVPDYGRLSGAQSEDIEGRIDTVEGKRHPQDFAIWRKTPAGETRQMEWDSPWGKGAPGWHLECSQMSIKYLGEKFDIHTGGIDHREIHHPNEIAQNQAHNCSEHSGANIWMHNNFLIDRAGKMSKSKGEFLRLELLKYKGFHPLSFRLMCLQAHYRSELEFSWSVLESAQTRLKRILAQIEKLKNRYYAENTDSQILPYPRYTVRTAKLYANHPRLVEYLTRFDKTLCDDLNTPEALPILEQLLKEKRLPIEEHIRTVRSMFFALGLSMRKRSEFRQKPANTAIGLSEIKKALREREIARQQKDFVTSDAIRNQLYADGVEVMDGDPLGWEWKIDI